MEVIPRANHLHLIDNSVPSKKYIQLIVGLDHRQASILFQLHTEHIRINHHLFCIHRSETQICPNCQGFTVKTVKHYLLECPFEYFMLQRELRGNTDSLSFLLSSPVTVLPLLKFIHATGRFKSHFGKNPEDKIQTNTGQNVELLSAAEQFKTAFSNIIIPAHTL